MAPQTCDILTDFHKFERKIRLNHHFKLTHNRRVLQGLSESSSSSENDDYQRIPSRSTTSWTPPAGKNHHLDLFLNLINQDINNHQFPRCRPNLNPTLRSALTDLKNNKDIIIKPADKGGATVIQNKANYIKEAMRQLNNPLHYKKLNKDPTSKTNNAATSLIKSLIQQEMITKQVGENMINRQPRTPCLYLLPKIHKPGNPGRPIVSTTGSPTDLISQYVDSRLRPYVYKISSYIKDSTHFLQILNTLNHIPSTATLCTIDVSSLYTNIPHQEGIDACIKDMSTPSANTLGTLINFILKNNFFEFNKDFYQQIYGTAMGTAMAPSYANMFMNDLENKFLNQSQNQPYLWIRYIDDIFMIWLNNQESLLQFINELNDFHPTIKFTKETSNIHINYLDITVELTNNHIQTKSYHKPTDANTYLHYNSCHPKHQKDSIPYSQFLRMKRNSSTPNDS